MNTHSLHSLNCCKYTAKTLSSAQTAQAILLKKIVIRSNGSGYLFEKNCYLFQRLGISVQKNMTAVQTALAICWGKNC